MLARACDHHDVVFVQNADDQSDLTAMGVVRDPSRFVLTAGEGIDLAAWTVAPLPAAPVFLMLSRLLVSKGVREYIQAAQMLRAQGSSARILLAGPEDPGTDGVPMREVRAAHDAGLLEYLGFVEDVPALMATCSVCVLPSWHEGTSHTLLEAMAMGRPVITTDVRGCRETVRPGQTGLLAAVRDPASLARAMQSLASDAAARARMGAAGRTYAEQNFDADDVAAKVLRSLSL
jgi:glycosyltransferase involved in cell wall biosynthesis